MAYRQRAGKLDRKHGVSRSWVYRFTSPVTKRVRMMGLGSCDVVPLAEARDLAKHARKLVTFGADPIEHRNATEAAEREAYLHEQASKMTFAACVSSSTLPSIWRASATRSINGNGKKRSSVPAMLSVI